MDFSLSQLIMPTPLSLGQRKRANFPKFFSTSFPFSQVQMSSHWCSHSLRNSQDFWERHQASPLGMWPRPGGMASPESCSASLDSSFFRGENRGERRSPFYSPFPGIPRTALNQSVHTGSPEEIASPVPGSVHHPREEGEFNEDKAWQGLWPTIECLAPWSKRAFSFSPSCFFLLFFSSV